MIAKYIIIPLFSRSTHVKKAALPVSCFPSPHTGKAQRMSLGVGRAQVRSVFIMNRCKVKRAKAAAYHQSTILASIAILRTLVQFKVLYRDLCRLRLPVSVPAA
jgi:hypothetical protein